MSGWGEGSLAGFWSYVVLVTVGFGLGLTLAPINNAIHADCPPEAHGTASALVVVTRMVGMVVGLALLTAIGLYRYYGMAAALPDYTDVNGRGTAVLLGRNPNSSTVCWFSGSCT